MGEAEYERGGTTGPGIDRDERVARWFDSDPANFAPMPGDELVALLFASQAAAMPPPVPAGTERGLAGVEVFFEAGGWVVIVRGLPVHATGITVDEALDEAVTALREYADDWNDHLHTAPNHRDHRPVVEFLTRSTDQQIRARLAAHAPRP
jgi:predicted RNase H-like HicB family nuclease